MAVGLEQMTGGSRSREPSVDSLTVDRFEDEDRAMPMVRVPRRAIWSRALTSPIAAVIPARSRTAALATIKAAHTAIFVSVGGLLLLFVWDGVFQRPRRRTAIALGVILTESAIYASNNQVCPLTPLAEELGAEHGSVADIFLPDWVSRRIPLFSGSALMLGLVLNVVAWLRDPMRRPGSGTTVGDVPRAMVLPFIWRQPEGGRHAHGHFTIGR